jgi:hypothetical protein
MASQLHTYGPTCLLYDPETERMSNEDPNVIPPPPKLRAQFFYMSPFPIDDPLTPLPVPSGSSTAQQTKLPPRPFSVRDTIALEEAWQGLISTMEDLAARHHRELEDAGRPDSSSSALHGDRLKVAGGDPGSSGQRETARVDNRLASLGKKRQSVSIPRRAKAAKYDTGSSPTRRAEDATVDSRPSTPRTGQRSADASISGSPFIRAPIRDRRNPQLGSETPISQLEISAPGGASLPQDSKPGTPIDETETQKDRRAKPASQSRPHSSAATSTNELESTVTVGTSRLHQVELPKLQVSAIRLSKWTR